MASTCTCRSWRTWHGAWWCGGSASSGMILSWTRLDKLQGVRGLLQMPRSAERPHVIHFISATATSQFPLFLYPFAGRPSYTTLDRTIHSLSLHRSIMSQIPPGHSYVGHPGPSVPPPRHIGNDSATDRAPIETTSQHQPIRASSASSSGGSQPLAPTSSDKQASSSSQSRSKFFGIACLKW